MNYSDIILRHGKSIVSSREQCDITTKFGEKLYASPVCCSNMKSILTPNICKIFDDRYWFYVYHRMNGVQDVEQFVWNANGKISSLWKYEPLKNTPWNSISISVGIGKEWEYLIARLAVEGMRIDAITVDIALSYTDNIIPIIEVIKEKYPSCFLIVGNGATKEWVDFIENLNMVDCIKCGIGVSKSCRTRQFTGFGSTTVDSLVECVEAAKKVKIMSDGGLTVDSLGEVWIGDINKALVLGADYVMSGAVFSKCLDSPSVINGYYGNASEQAKGHKKHVEGATVKIETCGLTISEMCDKIEDSIKSGISYAGGKDLKAFNNVKWKLI